MIRTPFGRPRVANLKYIRNLASSPYIAMVIHTILSEMKSVKWSVNISEDAKDKYESDTGVAEEKLKQIKQITDFLKNPNTNKETFDDLFIDRWLKDMLEVGSGVLVKVFDAAENLVEIVAADGATFTKNPDVHGMITSREEIIVAKELTGNYQQSLNDPTNYIFEQSAQNRAAYFQFQWSALIPVPFGKREVVWMDWDGRTDKTYGYSPVQTLEKTIQMLIYSTDSELDYYNNNNTPKSIIGLEGSDTEEVKAFANQMRETGLEQDANGNWHRNVHKTLFVNYVPKVERLEFTSQELQALEKQKWYTKMCWAMYGVTSTELGYTEDTKGMGNQIVQSKVSWKKSLNPILRKMEDKFNREILSEFGYEDLEFKFNMEDIEEEQIKQDLYNSMLETDMYSINELRRREGLEPVEWGDGPQEMEEEGMEQENPMDDEGNEILTSEKSWW